MSTYKDLLQERVALEARIEQARQREISEAVSQVRALVAEFGLTSQDVFPTGKAPKWIDGQDRTKFLIA